MTRVLPGLGAPRREGVLLKWVNYMKGFQPRYFVLDKGTLAYHRSKDEMAHTCRGTLMLVDARIENGPGTNFIVYAGANQHSGQSYHLRATSEDERSAWISALQLAKVCFWHALYGCTPGGAHPVGLDQQHATNRRTRRQHSAGTLRGDVPSPAPKARSAPRVVVNTAANPANDSGEDYYSDEESEALATDQLPNLQPILKQASELQDADGQLARVLLELEAGAPAELEPLVQAANEAVGRLSRASRMLTSLATQHDKHWARHFQTSEAKRADLADALESLARDHKLLQGKARRMTQMLPGSTASTDQLEADVEATEDEFFDADDGSATPALDAGAPVRRTATQLTLRSRIPFKPDKPVSLWNIMKNCIGRDVGHDVPALLKAVAVQLAACHFGWLQLSKIPMPVNFSEPLSFLQRLSEDCEYSELLDKAAGLASAAERMAYVAAFTMSPLASGAWRTGKPFNPLLGETFELDRSESLGFRVLLEQVSHHPPICALHAISERGWVFWQEFAMKSKFRGKYLQVIPTGVSHLLFPERGDHYTWVKVPTTIHNIIVGKLWLENAGMMTITDHGSGLTCDLDFKAYSIFSSQEPRHVDGLVKDIGGKPLLGLSGTWDTAMYMHAPEQPEVRRVELWRRYEHIPDYDKMYGFTKMAIESNQFTPWEEGCAITDARFRMDKNLMEIADFDMANRVKHLLEEAQRHRRRQYEETQTTWSPRWFELRPDPTQPGRAVHQYKGGYWEAKAKGSFEAHALVDLYDLTAVEGMDPDAAKAAAKAKLINAWKPATD